MAVPIATHFYRYKSPDDLHWLKETLLLHRLYFPLPDQLNDPVDARPRIEMSADDVARFLHRQWRNEHPSADESKSNRVLKDINDGIGLIGLAAISDLLATGLHERYVRRRIFSMSKRWDSLSMWATYAADHTGYCLEFANAGAFADAREVEYVDVVTEDPNDETDLGGFYFRKTRDWSNEEEVRVVRPRHTPGMLGFDPALLTRIILGKAVRRTDRCPCSAARPRHAVWVVRTRDGLRQRLVLLL